MTRARVLLVDDHNLVRAGLRSLIDAKVNIDVVGKAANGDEALAGITTTLPDVVVADISMAGVNGIQLAARLKRDYTHIKVVVLSVHEKSELVYRTLTAGACGYLFKDSATKELEFAIRAALRGHVYLSPAVSRRVVDGYPQQSGAGPWIL